MWTEKYRPDTLKEFKGSSKTVQEVRAWVEDWSSDQSKKAILLHGPPGCGKTALVHALANDMGRELVETNASDTRTKKAVKERLEQAVKQRSFTGKQKLVLIDEVDGMGRSDRGGRGALRAIITESRFPVIMTANDPYASGMQTLRNAAKVVELGKVHTNSVAARLRDICEEEGVTYEDGAMKAIARRADGDLRSAINDLESLALRGAVTEEDVRSLGYRETGRDIFEALKIIFKTMDVSNASDATEGLDENYDDVMQWIRENVPKEYKRPGDVARAFDALSKADVFRGRMVFRQNWGLMKYVYALMTAGVALAKEEKYSGFTRYGYPSRLKKMGRSKATRNKRKQIGEKIGDALHVSTTDANELMPFLALLFEDADWKENIVREMELEEDEVEFIEAF